jgi:transitional endoplasmic reticulum ATPase
LFFILQVKASDILDQWLGGSEAAIRSIFARTRAAAPCILLFDELDALATNREVEDGGSTDVYSRLLSTLLNEMDGVNSGGGDNSVLVVGTTNRIHAIDAALLRPGRFEKHILLQKPTINDIEEIMKLHLSKAPLDQDVNFSEISELLHELAANGADIRGICTETCLIAMRDADTATHLEEMFVRTKDFDEAIRVWKK